MFFIIICIIGCLSTGWVLGETYYDNDSKKIKIVAWIMFISMAFIMSFSIISYKEAIINSIIYEHYHIQQTTETTVTYKIISDV